MVEEARRHGHGLGLLVMFMVLGLVLRLASLGHVCLTLPLAFAFALAFCFYLLLLSDSPHRQTDDRPGFAGLPQLEPGREHGVSGMGSKRKEQARNEVKRGKW